MGMVIPWLGRSAGKARRPPDEGEPRGQILFFTGVRYERNDDAGGSAADAAKRRSAPRGRRKRA